MASEQKKGKNRASNTASSSLKSPNELRLFKKKKKPSEFLTKHGCPPPNRILPQRSEASFGHFHNSHTLASAPRESPPPLPRRYPPHCSFLPPHTTRAPASLDVGRSPPRSHSPPPAFPSPQARLPSVGGAPPRAPVSASEPGRQRRTLSSLPLPPRPGRAPQSPVLAGFVSAAMSAAAAAAAAATDAARLLARNLLRPGRSLGGVR